MKKILFFAATAFLFAACSSDEGNAPKVDEVVPQAVAFDTYTAGTTTRAGRTGVMTTATLQESLANGGGFGVFAYQKSAYYSVDAASAPDFMYNEPVKYASSAWSYDILKYWPNNTTADMHSNSGHATTGTNSYLSFFAYAPYVTAGASGEPGITAISTAATTGAPTIGYQIATNPTQSVDLLWGVTPDDWQYTNVAGTIWNSDAAHNGKPLMDLLKPNVDTRVKFLFLHALARLGINVVAAVDQEAAGGTLDAKTKIVLESVTITDVTSGGANLPTTGTLNLNNVTAKVANWTATSVASGFTSTLNGAAIENSLLYDTDAATSYAKEGVLASKEKPVIANGQYYMLIPPTAATTLQVNIVYDVITLDTKLETDYAVVQNNITKNVNVTFQNGKAYTLKLVLGLTSVKLDAEVENWDAAAATVVDLPQNYLP